jgi:branched-chain amino acid transport system permease protein
MKQYKKIPMLLRYAINLLLFAALLAVGSLLIKDGVISKYYSKVLMLIGINIILAVSLNISTGYLGQLPLGHAGFMAVGAYASAIFMIKVVRLGMSASVALPFGLLIGGVAAGLFGILIGIPALRLKGDYLAIITLGFGEIIRVVLLNIDSVLALS